MSVQALHDRLREGAWVDVVAEARAMRAAVDAQTPQVEAVLARAWVRLGQPPDALEAARSAWLHSDLVEVGLALGEALLASGDPGGARARLDQARERCEDGSPLAAEVDRARAMVLQASGEPELGLGLATRLLVEAEAGDDALSVEECLIVVGHTAWASGRLDTARGAFERALTLRLGRTCEPTLVAEALDGLGVCARHDNAPFESVELHRRALEQWVAGTGEESGPVSACRHRLAQALHRTGDFLAAREEMRRALLATGATLGRDHVDTWITRFELARYEVDCGRPEHGLPRMAEAREEVARRLGDTHPVVRTMDRYL